MAPPQISGYIGEKINLTLNEENLKKYNEDNPYVVLYSFNDKAPVIEGLSIITVKIGEPVDLRAGVTDKDSNGADLTKDIKINPEK